MTVKLLRRTFQTANIIYLTLAIVALSKGYEVSHLAIITGLIAFVCFLPLEAIKPEEMAHIGRLRMVHVGVFFLVVSWGLLVFV